MEWLEIRAKGEPISKSEISAVEILEYFRSLAQLVRAIG